MAKSNLEKLEFLCKADDLSFIIIYDNHKRFGLTVREYIKKIYPDGFNDPEGQKWVNAMEKRNSIVIVEVFNNEMKPLFVNFDVLLEAALIDTIDNIQKGVHLQPGEWIDNAPAPVD